MSVYLHLDSTYRDLTQYPKPSEWKFTQGTTLWTNTRTVQCVRPTNARTACNLVYNVKLEKLIIPVDSTTFPNFLADNPYLYVTISTGSSPDVNSINTMGQATSGAKTSNVQFVVFWEKTQGTSWYHYSSPMVQSIRWNSNEPVNFALRDLSGNVLAFPDEVTIDPAAQISCLLSTTPYVRDGSYDNHLVTLYDAGTF
ncbi:hypothetical protein B1750_gp166 [Noumeavirus]|uniref:Uncharacterized protein n=1 Tax=Marseillevirus sp. TaxID=2809551 RepID=A0AA96IYN3_9VIRU|nr:hypothetical protein B1750_gp166 [Noumeavirus]AQM73147.1 hypothetical protein NMV_166 [Noumeavirus]AQQ73729.1 hypothetical protein [Kurlavirus BKC-1]QZX43833.1 hypothetical protein MarQu_251 [Marseillevirus sp.]WNL50401.1 hypothetical protein MarDSR_362 [Marseillevirus sp.]